MKCEGTFSEEMLCGFCNRTNDTSSGVLWIHLVVESISRRVPKLLHLFWKSWMIWVRCEDFHEIKRVRVWTEVEVGNEVIVSWDAFDNFLVMNLPKFAMQFEKVSSSKWLMTRLKILVGLMLCCPVIILSAIVLSKRLMKDRAESPSKNTFKISKFWIRQTYHIK
jgi:hypothetical protein